MELVVVLVLVAILAALAAPMFRAPSAPRSGPLAEVVLRARGLALERAEPLTLAVRADGAWTLAAARAPDAPLLTGRLAEPQRPVAIALSPIGLCVPDDASAWDAARCQLVTP